MTTMVPRLVSELYFSEMNQAPPPEGPRGYARGPSFFRLNCLFCYACASWSEAS